MTVRQWKRVITGFVVLLIVTLGVTAAYAEVRYQRLATEFEGEAVEESADSEQNLSIDYQKKYDNLYVQNDFEYKEAQDSICYLTFDDGPSTENTEKILDILKKYNIKFNNILDINIYKTNKYIRNRANNSYIINIHRSCIYIYVYV